MLAAWVAMGVWVAMAKHGHLMSCLISMLALCLKVQREGWLKLGIKLLIQQTPCLLSATAKLYFEKIISL